MSTRRESGSRIELPAEASNPLRTIGTRVAIAIGLITFVALLTYFGRDGYVDPADSEVGLLDAFYYSTVSITTTGYGDVRPESDSARLITTVLVTPARILFLILLVGTTLEVLAERTRARYRLSRWRRTLKAHVIICGFGTKGRAAANTLLAHGLRPDEIVAVDERPTARAEATSMGLAAVAGSAATQQALREAGIEHASKVIVAVNRDDAAVLATLTARELNPGATIVAAVREDENAHLLHEGGADSVITSSSAAGRLLGLATTAPHTTQVLEDLLSVGAGLDIIERPVADDEVGPLEKLHVNNPVVAVVRGDELLRFDDPRAKELRPGDSMVLVVSRK
ncbi:MAG: voltage-gated potassium channel [Thermoleophilaceae bacterium]|jgi:voltage-gated potassium channel|nr:voltage-gated potassium channel [Thermoleophilaceae bacterium]